MPRRTFRFASHISRHDIPHAEVHGPRFHCWLPDGERDAVELNTEESAARLRVWFERHGHMENGFIKFADREHTLDRSVIPMQGMLEAGPLLGDLTIDLSDNDVDMLSQGGAASESIARRI